MVIYEGLIANHDKDAFYGQIEINDRSGLITSVVEIANRLTEKPDQTFGRECTIYPGMGDTHIHAREDQEGEQNYKEEYITFINAAINGGLTHGSAMPNQKIPLTTMEDFIWHRNRLKQIDHAFSTLNYVGIGLGTRPIGKPKEHPYKTYFGKSVGNLTFYNEFELDDTLQYYRGHNISWHIEYEPFIEASIDGRTHTERRPRGAINHGLDLAVKRVEDLALEAKFCHWSTGGYSLEKIYEHRMRAYMKGLPRTKVELSPLHILFDTSMTDEDKSLWLKIQMNPAIQAPKDRLELIGKLKDGFVDLLATDHAPHTAIEKHKAFEIHKKRYPGKNNIEIAMALKIDDRDLFEETCCKDGMSGAPWVDTYANVCALLIEEHKFKTQDIARVTAYNPGLFVNPFLGNQFPEVDFGKGFGKIEKGYVGSLTILNKTPVTITADQLQTKVGWSPLEGMKFPGGLEAVIIRGKNETGNFMLN